MQINFGAAFNSKANTAGNAQNAKNSNAASPLFGAKLPTINTGVIADGLEKLGVVAKTKKGCSNSQGS